jgi:hypothetical protein
MEVLAFSLSRLMHKGSPPYGVGHMWLDEATPGHSFSADGPVKRTSDLRRLDIISVLRGAVVLTFFLLLYKPF